MKYSREVTVEAVSLLDLSNSTTATRNDESNVSTYEMDQRYAHQLLRADVHRCNSLVCPTCLLSHETPTFVLAPKLDPSSIRRLPPRWWDTTDASATAATTVASEKGIGTLFAKPSPLLLAATRWSEAWDGLFRCHSATKYQSLKDSAATTGKVHKTNKRTRTTAASSSIASTTIQSPKESVSTDETETEESMDGTLASAMNNFCIRSLDDEEHSKYDKSSVQ